MIKISPSTKTDPESPRPPTRRNTGRNKSQEALAGAKARERISRKAINFPLATILATGLLLTWAKDKTNQPTIQKPHKGAGAVV